METLNTLEIYFANFRDHIIGGEQTFESPYGSKKILYADWTASGRAYQPIEVYMQQQILPFVANTHTGSTVTGSFISQAYQEAKATIKQHVNAGSDDVLIFCGSGMTAAVNKLQRILGLRIPERLKDYLENEGSSLKVKEELRPVVFVTHMEHHSNHISWLETIATVEIIGSNACGNVDLDHFEELLQRYRHRTHKIAAVTACSNVTGIETPYHEIARIIHQHDGLCFVDFACSAPYVDINMHPDEKSRHLDAIYFSPHKFLGGPGTPGVLIFNKNLYTNNVPDQPGGGTIAYSNPWKEHIYIDGVEEREDGGTPPFLQGIKAALCIRLKESMGTRNIRERKKELLAILFKRFEKITNTTVLGGCISDRLGVVSFIIRGAHYNLVVKLLNDRFGIQTRGGCSCAGSYGHYLLGVTKTDSQRILGDILSGNLQDKPGWVRLSIHPTMTDDEMHLIMDAIGQIAAKHTEWGMNYRYCPASNEFIMNARVSDTHYNVIA
ncbi:MAG TPA: aminotransferase class V-fold PLP-dependent enzyme [Mucilaginibacter sp.]|nr:aminotransferase class V-fold PLP-dependent enzyme [Mucilaginibacter sp.]